MKSKKHMKNKNSTVWGKRFKNSSSKFIEQNLLPYGDNNTFFQNNLS